MTKSIVLTFALALAGLSTTSHAAEAAATAAAAPAAEVKPAAGLEFKHKYAAAAAESKKSGKPMIVIFSASWCGPCQTMKKKVYPSDEVKPFHDKFVWAYLDADEEENAALMKKYKVEGIPHIQFLGADEKELDKQVGSSDPAAFAKLLTGVLAKAGPKK